MSDLSRDLRGNLENVIKAARLAAEAGAGEALRRLGAAAAELPAHLESRRAERNRLRAHARTLGDRLNKDGTHDILRLTEAAAYVQWHRLLFARFLLERGLLRDEAGVPLSLTDCREEAAMDGKRDEWSVAAIHAARLLPGVFPPDDPVESLTLAPEHAKALRDHLRGLDAAIFAADDSLGWTYQFWRAAEKKAVNESQVPTGAAELPAVTQLFTEPYIVRFLLHNTLGAWWAGKVLSARPELTRDAADEASLRAACGLPGYSWDYLRFVREDGIWRPAAGAFTGWPTRAAEITLLDPCCGSGHFLTEALKALAPLRGEDEGLPPADAVVAVLRDNLHGLEIDGRCVQIAAFALALTAWRISGVETKLPTPHVAWVGAPPLPKSEFAALANGDADLRRGLEALHDLFAQAPLLGSFIEVTGGDLASPMRIARIEGSIVTLVEKMRGAEPERVEGALAARGMADAAAILARRFVLQATNVPFLGRGKQDAALATFLAARFESAKADLATAMLTRMRALATQGGTVAAVTPQNWLFLGSYKKMREALLEQASLVLVAVLGEHGFDTSAAAGAFTALVALTEARPDAKTAFAGLDANDAPDPSTKAQVLQNSQSRVLRQDDQLSNPDARITLQALAGGPLLGSVALSGKGSTTGDSPNYHRFFWEFPDWVQRRGRWLDSPKPGEPWSGRSLVLRVQIDSAPLVRELGCWIRGQSVWGKSGVAVNKMRGLEAFFYDGEVFDDNINPIVPSDRAILPAVWAFCSSPDYAVAVRRIDRKLNVTNSTLVKVPFDAAYWQRIAAAKFPKGLPDPYSDDPTQWVFHGHPRYAEPGTELHVALARLAGYRWPAETDREMRLSGEARARIAQAATLPEGDADGLLALVPVLGDRSLADRLRAYCTAAWGGAWTASTEATLIGAACKRAKDRPPKQMTLDVWLRTHAARQHTKLFHDRPFLWWITDGRADGFTAVANYHRLTRANLERLAYTVLGDWLTRLGDDPRSEAAQLLQPRFARILEGEAPYDIFVRWKSLEKQPLGWDPDHDDGVRLNIRPFLEAKVLAFEPNVKYGVDRGKDVASAPWYAKFNSKRRNDHHTTLAEKRAARVAPATAAK